MWTISIFLSLTSPLMTENSENTRFIGRQRTEDMLLRAEIPAGEMNVSRSSIRNRISENKSEQKKTSRAFI